MDTNNLMGILNGIADEELGHRKRRRKHTHNWQSESGLSLSEQLETQGYVHYVCTDCGKEFNYRRKTN